MLLLNFSFTLFLFAVGTMTSCHSFVMQSHGKTFKRTGALYESDGSDPVIPDETKAPGGTNDNGSSLGIDEDFIPFPHQEYTASDVVQMCMHMLTRNGKPYANAGMEVCWNFSTDRCRAAQGGSLEMFIQYAHNPIFGSMVNALDWQVVSTGPLIQGTATRGAMQTVLVNVQPQQGAQRRFLWTLQQERRPPRQGCWLVWECLSVENAFSHTL